MLAEGRSHRYGWPGNFNLKGPFWTNEGNKEEIFRCLDFIFQTSDSEWEVVKKFIDPIIIFDEENKNFKNNLKKIGLSIN